MKAESTETPEVGFPLNQPRPKSKSSLWIFLLLGIIILIGGIIFYVSRSNKTEISASPTPEFGGINDINTIPTPTAAPSSTPSTTDRSKVKIEIENGTGVTGEAAYLQGVLKTLGYNNLTVANAPSQDNVTTTITFAKTVSQSIVSEITDKLNSLYQNVTTTSSDTAKTDVVIVTGLRKGMTPKPSVSPTPKASASPSASPTASPTAQ